MEELKFTNDIYADVYGKDYTDKIKYLQRAILEYYTDENQFNVINLEAGLGKSFYTDLILENFLWEWEKWDSKFLIVKRFNSEIEKSVKSYETTLEMFSEPKIAFGEGKSKKKHIPIVLGITSDNWNKEWKNRINDLKKVKIIYISHQRYIGLCKDEDVRKAFAEGRDTLIIDEKILFPIQTFNDGRYTKVWSALPTTLRPEFEKVCKKLNDFLAKMAAEKKTNECVRFEMSLHPATLKNFRELVKINEQNIEKKNRNMVYDLLDGLDVWYGTKCIYNAGNISGFDRNYKYWGLNNNIILDASARIDGYAKVNPSKFNLIRQSRIIDHSNSKFYHVKFNSSKTSMKQNEKEFFPEIVQKAIERKKKDDKTLIVCHKDNADKIKKLLLKHVDIVDVWIDKKEEDDPEYNGQSIAISWYGNLIGKNTFEKFTQVWLIGTPNIPQEQYLLMWMMHTEKELGNRSLEIIRKKCPDQGMFKNDEFRAIQKGYIAAEFYQSIKRIQRNHMPEGEFFIVCKNDELVQTVVNEMIGAKLEEKIEMDFVQKQEEQKQANKKPNQADILHDYLLKHKKGTELKKKDISSALKISKLNRVILDDKIRNMHITGKITVTNKSIVIN